MKTVTLRLARRLASLVELRDVQRAVINDAFGAYTWIDEIEPDDVDLKLVATKRRKEAARRTTISAFHPGPPDVDPIAERQHRHDRDHPVGRDVDIGELAVCLMMMPALRRLGARNLLAALHRVQPVIAVHGAVCGFERRFAGLLDEMLRVPRVKLRVLTIDSPNKLDASMRSLDTTLPVLNIQSSAFNDDAPVALRKCLAKAMRERMPIVVTGDTPPVDLPARVAVVLDLTLQAAPLDWPMLAELIDAKTGIDAEAVLNAVEAFPMDLAALSLDDLAMSIRPGHDLETILARLQVLAAASAAEPAEDDETKSKEGRTSGSTWKRNRNGTAGTGSTRIDPQPVPAEGDVLNPSGSDRAPAVPAPVVGEVHAVAAEVRGDVHDVPAAPNATGNARMDVGSTEVGAKSDASAAVAADAPARTVAKRPAPVPTVETLAGYGDARTWALTLMSDLDLWRAGSVPWSDLSTKLLLSGPPGTGKTTFARALGNTLQLPVFATSVATWLEASHLGDVLARMRDCFDEVQAARPCILFIDEIDGIGRRQDQTREYADYWNAIVNKALELMDGALKSDGIIIVGATNRPNDIEPALRRSGRLETHIVIPTPDMHALESIIAFHLGDDIDGVAATMPSARSSAAEPAGDQDRRRDPSEPMESVDMRRDQRTANDGMASRSGDATSTGDDRSTPRKRKRSRASIEARAAAIEGSDQTVIAEGGMYGGQPNHPGKAGAGEGTEAPAGPAAEPGASTASGRQMSRTMAARVSTRTFDPPGSDQTKPGFGDRQHILRAHALRLLARTARGMTGADVERVIREERQRCRRAQIAMSFDGVRDALRGERATHSDALRRQMAIHEAGHAVVARALKLGIQVDLTIDDAEGGQSRLAANMGDIQTEGRMTDVLAMLLAGRAAEMIHDLQPLAGSGMIDGSDLQIATRLALDLECRGGFSERTPLLYVDPVSTNALYSARPDAYQRANARLEDALSRAKRLIDWARPAHAALTEQLLVYGTLDGAEVDAILEPLLETEEREQDEGERRR
ncbi:MAG: AAA family ATPase [Rhizobiaceae bacterium]|nr:AAA family ATPase [Rhizobiaceae bacterium]